MRLNSEPVAIADMLAHAKGRVILGVSNGTLFRSVGIEEVAREEMLESGRLQAVFSMPPGMAYPTTMIATSLLVLDHKGARRSNVRFIDLSNERFASKTARGRMEAREEHSWVEILDADPYSWDADLELVDHDGQGWDACVIDVPLDEIRGQGGILTIERYLKAGVAQSLAGFHERYELAALEDVVELIRPVALPKFDLGKFQREIWPDDAESNENAGALDPPTQTVTVTFYDIFEAAPGDVGERGFLERPAKADVVERSSLRKARNQQLRPGDVVLSVKGTIGRVGLVPETAPDELDANFWTAGQSLMILRPKGRRMSSVALYEYLSDEIVQEFLHSLSGGTAIRSINAKDLRKLQIPIPAPEMQREIEASFNRRQKLHDEVDELRAEIDKERQRCWPHRDLAK